MIYLDEKSFRLRKQTNNSNLVKITFTNMMHENNILIYRQTV